LNREYNSLVFRRYLLAVLILVLACELGLTAQLYVEKQMLSEAEAAELNYSVDGPAPTTLCDNDEIEFSTYYPNFGPGRIPEPRELVISNHSTDVIYFSYGDVQVKDRSHPKFTSTFAHDADRSLEASINVGDTESFPLSALEEDGPFELSFQYRVGKNGPYKSFSGYFIGYVPTGCFRLRGY
jgi:hypothetical protein